MRQRAQGALEYILLLAGILLIVVLVIAILRSNFSIASQQIGTNVQVINRLNCLPTWFSGGSAHRWGFDEGSGTTTSAATGGTVGTLIGGESWDAAGISGSAVVTGEKYVLVPHTDSLDLAGDAWTIEVWIKPSSYATYYLVSKRYAYRLYFIPEYPGPTVKIGGFVKGVTSGSLGDIISNTILDDDDLGTWQHVALTYEKLGPSSSILSLYINGKLDATKSYTSTYSPFNPPQPLEFPDEDWRFRGSIDEVVFYNRALTPQEVDNDYACVGNTHV